MRIRRLAPLALLLVSPIPAAAGTRPLLPLTVRVYDMTGDTHADRRAALAAAAAALAPAQVEVRWLEGQTADLAGPGAQDLVLRLVRQQALSARPGTTALGYAFVDAQGRQGTLATIFLDRVEQIARIAGTPADQLTGLAIAHEIGHLLRGSDHSKHGLMRARWTVDEVRAGRGRDWRLDAHDGDRLRTGLTSRLGTRAAVPTQAAALMGLSPALD